MGHHQKSGRCSLASDVAPGMSSPFWERGSCSLSLLPAPIGLPCLIASVGNKDTILNGLPDTAEDGVSSPWGDLRPSSLPFSPLPLTDSFDTSKAIFHSWIFFKPPIHSLHFKILLSCFKKITSPFPHSSLSPSLFFPAAPVSLALFSQLVKEK